MQLQIYINLDKLDADCADDADFFVCVSQIIRVICVIRVYIYFTAYYFFNTFTVSSSVLTINSFGVIPVCFLNHRLKCCG